MRWVLVLLTACSAPGADPSGTDGGGDDDDPLPANDGLLPLAADRAWTYDVTSTYPSCPGGVHEQRVLGTDTLDGRTVFRVLGFCGVEGKTFVDGDLAEDHYEWGPVGWTRMLDEPVTEGHAWSTTNGSATFGMHYERATVAGHDDCWTVVQDVSYKSEWTYCRGVGLVLFEMIDLGGGTIRAELQ